jgi:hypothetical protein
MPVSGYRPMTLAELARFLTREAEDEVRWKLVWEFLEEYRWEPESSRPTLVAEEPQTTGDSRWDALLAALAEYLNAQVDLAPPEWAEQRVLETPWFPSSLRILRVQALVWAPAAFRKHGVYLTAHDLAAA